MVVVVGAPTVATIAGEVLHFCLLSLFLLLFVLSVLLVLLVGLLLDVDVFFFSVVDFVGGGVVGVVGVVGGVAAAATNAETGLYVGLSFFLLLFLLLLILISVLLVVPLFLLNSPSGGLSGGGFTMVGSFMTYKDWCGAAN